MRQSVIPTDTAAVRRWSDDWRVGRDAAANVEGEANCTVPNVKGGPGVVKSLTSGK